MSFRDEIQDKIERQLDLPALPDIAIRLSQMVRDGHSSAADIAKLIQYDPVLAGRILQVANSAHYGSAARVGSIPQAITRIGFKRLKDLVLSLTLIQAFAHQPTRLDFRAYWRHSLGVAFAAQLLEQRAPKAQGSTDNSFSAGLLHDIGVLLLYLYADNPYHQVVTYAQAENRELHEAEQTILGIDHAEAGALLLELWNLPRPVWEAARYHHAPYPPDLPTGLLTKIVHLANFACNNQGLGNGVATFPALFSSGAWYDTGLSVEQIPGLITEVSRLTAEADEIIAAAR